MLLTLNEMHAHLKKRMLQRGVILKEINETLEQGNEASDAKPGTFGKVLTFPYNAYWEGKFYAFKEVTVYYKQDHGKLIPLTVKTRYGEIFSQGDLS